MFLKRHTDGCSYILHVPFDFNFSIHKKKQVPERVSVVSEQVSEGPQRSYVRPFRPRLSGFRPSDLLSLPVDHLHP